METNFLRFVLRHSWRWQMTILAITLAIFPLVYLSLELPKIIINDAIQGGEGPRDLLGVRMEQMPFLLTLCVALLALIGVINALKWLLNTTMGRTGERMLRRLRHALFEHVMRFPLARFRSAKQGELIQSMLGELEPVGAFIGEVIATPLFQGGLLLVYGGFIMAQDWRLGLAAIALFPLQAWLIPVMQARVIRLNRQRAIGARALADFIGDSVGGIAAIHADDGARWRLAQLSRRLHHQAAIRFDLFRRKYAIKAVNNLLNQLPPFFFYSIGGWLVIEGRLDFGALVAVLAAQKEMASPWRTLLVFVQNWTDYNARYGFVVEGFTGADLLPSSRVHGDPAATPLDGDMTIEIVDSGPGAGGLSSPRIVAQAGAQVAVAGGRGGPAESLFRMIAGLEQPMAGSVRLGRTALHDATLPQIGAAIGYVDPDPDAQDLPIRALLTAGLSRVPPPLTGEAARAYLEEARLTGNSLADPEGDWTDYAAAGVADAAALEARALALAIAAGLGPTLRALALDERIGAASREDWAPKVAAARAALATGDEAGIVRDLVEPWRRDAVNDNATLLDNLLFGAPVDAVSDPDVLLARSDVEALLRAVGAEDALVDVGEAIAREFAELVAAAGADSGVFADIPGYPRTTILAAAEMAVAGPRKGRARRARRRFMEGLAARFIPARDRFDVLDAPRSARLLALREAARPRLAARGDFAFFDGGTVNPGLSLLENVLGGARRYDRRGATRRLTEAVEAALIAAGAEDALLRLGLNARAGRDGARLTPAARLRIAVARALLKRPRVVVLAAPVEPSLRELARAEAPRATLFWRAESDAETQGADVVLRIDAQGAVLAEPGDGPAHAGGSPP